MSPSCLWTRGRISPRRLTGIGWSSAASWVRFRTSFSFWDSTKRAISRSRHGLRLDPHDPRPSGRPRLGPCPIGHSCIRLSSHLYSPAHRHRFGACEVHYWLMARVGPVRGWATNLVVHHHHPFYQAIPRSGKICASVGLLRQAHWCLKWSMHQQTPSRTYSCVVAGLGTCSR